MIKCNGLQCSKLNSSRYSTRSGYVGAPVPKAIVLHKLQNMDMASFRNQMCTPLPSFQCRPAPDCTFPYSVNPKGVHFIVDRTSYTQLAEISSATFGIDYIDISSPLTQSLAPITDPNGPWIHIAIDGDCGDSLATLLCCIGTELGLNLPIVTAGDLQSTRESFPINPMVVTAVADCIASGGFVDPPNIFDLQEQVNQALACCFANSSAIAALQTDVSQLNVRVTSLEVKVASLIAKVADLYDKVSVIPALLEAVTKLNNQVADILTRCCPTPAIASCFHYQLQAGDEMLVTPNQCIWLNLPTKIEDRDDPNCTTGCKGPIVKPGPLWMADLSTEDCTWKIDALVRFRLTEWCIGKKASMYLILCGKKYLLDVFTVISNGSQVVTLEGTFTVPGPSTCKDVHLLICENDDQITENKVVEFADIKGCCV